MAKRTTTPTIDALQAQRAQLVQRLGATEREAVILDPLNDWEKLSRLVAEAQTLERAIATADARITQAQREAAQAAVVARAEANSERARLARANLDDVARRVATEAQGWHAGVVAELYGASRELAACGSYPNPAASVALQLAGSVAGAIDAWRWLAPTWVGLPEPPSPAAQALQQREQAVLDAERRLEAMRAMRPKHGEARPTPELLTNLAHGVAGCRASLLRYAQPELTDDEVFTRAYSGLHECTDFVGGYWESKRRAAAKAQSAGGGLLA